MSIDTISNDICIFCALHEEADALIKIFTQYAEVQFDKEHHPAIGVYYRNTFPNNNGETLTICVTWPVDQGPSATLLALPTFLSLCKPRFAAMTGICAGDRRRVFLGDLVVARFAYSYDEGGKWVDAQDGTLVYQGNTKTWHADRKLIQFAQDFKEWKTATKTLSRPFSKHHLSDWLLNRLLHVPSLCIDDIPSDELEQHIPEERLRKILAELQYGPKPLLTAERKLRDPDWIRNLHFERAFPFQDPTESTVYVEPLASGSSVRADNPFKEIQKPVRKTIAIDMEGAAFYQTLADFPDIKGLVVKGVCDYADQDKDDSFHHYAGEVSALYLLYFIKEYVTEARLPSKTTEAVKISDIANIGESNKKSEKSSSSIPLQFPRPAEHFTDRKAELAQLFQDLQPGKVVTIWGPGGIGKSALAAQAIWQLTGNNQPPAAFPDGVIWHDFYREPQIGKALEHIALSFGEEVRPTPLDAARRALSGRTALVLLDGTEEVDNLRIILTIVGNCGVIVTSRRRQDAVADRQELTPLPINEAIELLCAWSGDHATDECSIKKICSILGGLPLAARLVGRYLDESGESAVEYLEWLEEQPFDALHHGEHREESINVLLERSVAQLSVDAQHILAVFGILAFALICKDVLTAALPDMQFRRPLNELVNYGLVLRSNDRYIASHALIHTYARQHFPFQIEILLRIAAYYEAFVQEQNERGLPGYTQLDAERVHIMRILEACKEQVQWQSVSDLVWAVDDYLTIRGYWTERRTAFEIGIQAAQKQENRYDEERCLGSLGNAYRDLGREEQAIEHYEQALAIAREIGDRQGEGKLLGNLGNAYHILGQVEQAFEHYEQALAIAREIGDRDGEGNWLGSLGTAYSALGQVEQAIGYYEQALAIAREIGHRQLEGNGLGSLGLAYGALGQMEQAIGYYEQALAIAREIGHRQGEGDWLGCLGNAYRALGQVEQAIGYYEQALAIAREIGHRQGEGNGLGNLGNAYRALGQVEQAIGYYEQALAIVHEIGDRQGEGFGLSNLGNAYWTLGQVEQAKQCWCQSLVILEEIESPMADFVRKRLDELE